MENHWQEHKVRLQRYIAREVSEPSAVDDILQNVYLKAHTHIHTLKSEDRMGSWLYRIAQNAVMDYYRQQKPWDELPDSLAAGEEDEAERAHQELARCMVPFMDELPEKYRIPLQMSELQGMSQKQVAKALGLSLSGAKSRIQRGRVQLKERFIACCDIEVGRGGVMDYRPKKTGCKNC
ncbi:RNA polymerase sigma factor SigZ [Endozoicomonas sp. ALD040]|uniref:RNA polymerase sigma factor SigZ n=1 Tax=Endozoicomonas sp. ALD040 TaxID=3403079 RepID=UPI003BB18E7C